MTRDADDVAVRRSAVRIGVQVALVSAGLVVVIVGLVFAYVLWQSTPTEVHEQHAADTTRIFVDRDALLGALAVIGAGAVLLAGLATWFVARRAVVPLGEALRLQRTFVADASHELRTPLTVMSARVQQLQRRMSADDDRTSIVDALREDTRSLAAVVDDLLRAATMDGEDGSAATPVSAEVDGAVADLQVVAEQRAVRIVHRGDGGGDVDVAVRMSATPLRRALVALLDNAVGHAPAGSDVEVRVTATPRTVEIAVRDRGDGITGIDPDRVFDRFAHGTPAAGPAERRTSYGIGLALVREIAVRAGGSVRVGATGPGGTMFVLSLPRVTGGAEPPRPTRR